MRRSRGFSVGVLAAGLWLAGRAAPAQQIPVRLGGFTSSFVGVPFDVPLEVDMSQRSDKLGSFALTLRWNPAKLRFVRGQNGNFGDLQASDSAAAVDSGVVRLAGANPTGVGGHVVLGVARFVPLTTLTDTFRLNLTELYASGTFSDLLPSAVWSNQQYCNAVGRYGDMNGDGAVNSADALQALTYATGAAITGTAALGDVDGDGATGSRDALLMLAAGVGLDVSAFRVNLTAPGACAAPLRPLLALTPGNVTLDLAQQMRYTAFATDSTGAGLAVSNVVWRSSDTTVARVDTLGRVSALAAGSATVTASRPDGTSAAAVVTVLARRTHWVDALATPDPDNQVGAPELPFATIPQALGYARPGDTVMVRTGRYDDTVVVSRPVVLAGDTSGGAARPLISARSLYDFGLVVNTPGRVELHALRIDTLTQGVDVLRADTLLIRGVEFRAPASTYYASLYVDTASAVYIQRSAFFGSGTGYYYYNAGITINYASLVVIDSSVVAEYGDDGVDLYSVDSAFVRGSAFQHNAGNGVYATGPAGGMATVFRGNRFTQNGSSQVYLYASRGARFDHNHVLDSGSYGVQIFGADTTAGVSFLGDSLGTTAYGYPLYLSTYDTLSLDSTVVVARSGYSSLSGGRFVTVRDSKFLDVTNEALSLSSYPLDTTFVRLRKVEFQGAPKGVCDQCGYMVYGYTLSVDADSVTMTNMSYGFDLSDSRVVLNHATLQDFYQGVYTDCGYLNVANSSLTDGAYGVEGYGCTTGDSIIVTGSSFGNLTSEAVYASSTAATLVSNSQFTNAYYAVYHDCGQLRISNVTATGGYAGASASGCGTTDTLSVDQSSFAGFYYGADLSSGTQRVQNSQFTDNNYAVYATYAPAVIAGNQVTRPQYTGVYHYWYGADTSTVQIVNNTLSCDAYGALNATGIDAERPVSPAAGTMLVQGNTVANCEEGIYLSGGWNAVARGNTVALPTTVTGYRGIWVDPDTTAVVAGNTVSGWATQGAIYVANALRAFVDTNTVSGGVGVGLLLANTDSQRVRGNTITGQTSQSGTTSPGAAIRLDGGTLTNTSYAAELRYNRITGTTNGIVLNRTSNDTLTVQVDSNTVKGADSMGVWVRYYSRAQIGWNAVDSSGIDAMRVDQYSGVPTPAINQNNITRSAGKGVRNVTLYAAVDATNNWWGDASGPSCDTCTTGLGDSVSTMVTFSPWRGSPVSTFAPAPRLMAASSLAPMPAAGAPAAAATYTRRQAPTTTVAAAPQRRAVSPPPASPALRVAPPLTATNRVAQRLAAAAQVRAGGLEQRAAAQAAELRRLEAARAAHEQSRAAKRQADLARRAQRTAPPPREVKQ